MDEYWIAYSIHPVVAIFNKNNLVNITNTDCINYKNKNIVQITNWFIGS